MDEWAALRTIALICVWVTAAGGALMATIWLSGGGPRALGPEDQLGAEEGRPLRSDRRVTSFTTVQVGLHASVAILTAILVTYGLTYDGDRSDAYVAVLVAIVVTAIPGLFMVRKWRSGQRPALPAPDDGPLRAERVEDRIPAAVVVLHGLAAVTTFALIVALWALD